MSYYKSSEPEVLAKIDEYQAAASKLHDDAKAFANLFDGATPIVLSNDLGLRFAGLKFAAARNRDVWRAPGQFGEQCLRSKPKNAAAREAYNEVSALWKASAPAQQVTRELIYSAIGTSWDALLFHGLGYFKKDGTLYVETSAKLGDWMTEILGSEYHAAEPKS